MSFSAFDHRCMADALRLARKGLNTTHPNPRVGCVIVRDQTIVGQGWHVRAGEPHAEVNALREAGEAARGATAYVTLEPCSHSGRTPPCTEALIEAGIARVVCAQADPNPSVNTNGFARLRAAGIEVETGLLASQAEALNAGFLMRMRTGRPLVRVKIAQSMDGHISLADGSSKWITGPQSRADVQAWRARSDAVLTGIGTVLADDPLLNVRTGTDPRQPLRVIVDSRWRTPPDAPLFGVGGEVLVVGCDIAGVPADLAARADECVALPGTDGRVDLTALLDELGRREVNEVHVEAGPALCGSLLLHGLIDDLLVYQAPVLLGGGAVSPFAGPRLDNMDARVHLEWKDSRYVGNDLRMRLRPFYEET